MDLPPRRGRGHPCRTRVDEKVASIPHNSPPQSKPQKKLGLQVLQGRPHPRRGGGSIAYKRE